jgi:hypothetical protein
MSNPYEAPKAETKRLDKSQFPKKSVVTLIISYLMFLLVIVVFNYQELRGINVTKNLIVASFVFGLPFLLGVTFGAKQVEVRHTVIKIACVFMSGLCILLSIVGLIIELTEN